MIRRRLRSVVVTSGENLFSNVSATERVTVRCVNMFLGKA